MWCRRLTSEGARVLVADADVAAAKTVADVLNELGGGDVAAPLGVDVTSEQGAHASVAACHEQFGRLDVLVNGVGTYPHVAFDEMTLAQWREVITVNLDSVFLCAKAAVPVMRAHGGGKIINVSTNLVWLGLAGMVHYIAAKAGVVGFTRALAREVGEHGITVNAVAPGPIVPRDAELDGASVERLRAIVEFQSVKRPEEPMDLTGALVFLASSDSDFVTGQVLTVDGGLTTH